MRFYSPKVEGVFNDIAAIFDLVKFEHASGGKQRTEPEWKSLLAEGGFPRYNIIKFPSFYSIIEAFPN
ncbi:hypothetical protein CDL15_Pgr023339 [Punica granatum]|uniref:O-methyltransferase domain-containing protein n=1 Tax=Punica granatum TaxID=22663 RepID=A0A218Y2B0_PUNGR|nr:hypothetical protein CDL15_Pgr023339 [Punica granatum]